MGVEPTEGWATYRRRTVTCAVWRCSTTYADILYKNIYIEKSRCSDHYVSSLPLANYLGYTELYFSVTLSSFFSLQTSLLRGVSRALSHLCSIKSSFESICKVGYSPGEMESSESSESHMDWTNEEDGIAARYIILLPFFSFSSVYPENIASSSVFGSKGRH